MLNKKYNYVCIDFETTGLDVDKDEAIQLAIVKFDWSWNIIKQFCSYINPEIQIKEMAGFITGIKYEDLENAPKIQEMETEIKSFFDENTIVIWHNVNFDLSFLKKYFSDIKYYDAIDTFMLAQNLAHFAPSYALEVLIQHLKDKINVKLNIENEKDSKLQNHDALFDVFNTITLFLYFIGYILELIAKYPQLISVIAKTKWLWSDILEYPKPWAASSNTEISLPALSKQLPQNLSLSVENNIDLSKLEEKKKYYVGDFCLENLLKKLLANKKIILSFSSIAKLNITKKLLNEIGLHNIGFNTGEQKINHTKLTKFVNKADFEQWELFFVIKYLSHHCQKYNFLDTNNLNDWNILYYLKEENKYFQYPVVLSTHSWLFNSLGQLDFAYKNYDIVFFDTEFWYRSYNTFLSSKVDLYTTLNFIEKLIYKYQLDKNEKTTNLLQEFHALFCTFMGILFSELKIKFTNTSEDKKQINPIIDNIDFYKSNLFIKKLQNFYHILEEWLDIADWKLLISKLDKIIELFNSIVIVEKKLYSKNWDFYFLFQESVQFTDWGEFIDIFDTQKVYFLSNFDNKFDNIQQELDKTNVDDIDYTKIEDVSKIVDYIKNSDFETIFVLSAKKDKSKKLFTHLLDADIHQDYEILAENITGWVGKNIFKAKNTWKKIIIWWYNFILQIFANKININKIIVLDIKWWLEKLILNDILWYGKQKSKQ